MERKAYGNHNEKIHAGGLRFCLSAEESMLLSYVSEIWGWDEEKQTDYFNAFMEMQRKYEHKFIPGENGSA